MVPKWLLAFVAVVGMMVAAMVVVPVFYESGQVIPELENESWNTSETVPNCPEPALDDPFTWPGVSCPLPVGLLVAVTVFMAVFMVVGRAVLDLTGREE